MPHHTSSHLQPHCPPKGPGYILLLCLITPHHSYSLTAHIQAQATLYCCASSLLQPHFPPKGPGYILLLCLITPTACLKALSAAMPHRTFSLT
ncbi:hypothetical protein ACOMHN_057972 [Nucella lapillus]